MGTQRHLLLENGQFWKDSKKLLEVWGDGGGKERGCDRMVVFFSKLPNIIKFQII